MPFAPLQSRRDNGLIVEHISNGAKWLCVENGMYCCFVICAALVHSLCARKFGLFVGHETPILWHQIAFDMVCQKVPFMRRSNRPLTASSTLDFGVDRTDAESIQQQIARQVREFVLNGRLKPGAKLPSSRALAEQLNVARATVVEAYEQLAGEGYIETRTGSGTTVASELPEDLLASGKRVAKTISTKRAGREPALPFRTGLVDWETFPHDEWGRILGRYWRNPPISLLEHNDAFGWLPLRQAIAAHLFEWRGIACAAEQVIITAGGSDAFDLVRRALFQTGDQLWMEEPGYPTARRIFTLSGLDVVPVPVDAEGMQISIARQKAPKAKAAFVTPARQYPLGVTMPLSRRLELLDWAKATRAIIIEDDYDSEYRYVGKPLPAMMSLDRASSVIYSGTFSKVFSPIIRLGFIVVPQQHVALFRQERSNYGAPPSLLVQPALAQFMDQGQFAIHIRRMRRLYAARRKALLDVFAPYDSRLFQLDAPPSGLMIMLRLGDDVDDEALVARLERAGIETAALSSNYVGRKKKRGLMLSFAGFAEKELVAAAHKLISLL
jgi:GntR family transcriptional regulator / MocR family aminotransferase